MTTETLSPTRTVGAAEVLAAIQTASRATGSDFDYLLTTATRESNLDSKAKSKASSATGLFQFIDQTWLSLIKRYGKDHGLGRYADAISRTESGRLVVGSSEAKSAILALREDPEISALMAGEWAAATKQSLECALGRAICPGELYAAHFFGESGARRLIGLNERQPGMRADMAFPEAAKANRPVFYHADGRAKSIGEVHAWAVGEPAAPERSIGSGVVLASDAIRSLHKSEPVDAARARPVDENDYGNAVRGSRLVFSATSEPASEANALPRSPFALTAGVLDVLAGLAFPSTRRQG